MTCYYFGYMRSHGHGLSNDGEYCIYRDPDNKSPWKDDELDGTYCPGATKLPNGHSNLNCRQVEGDALLHYKDGWTLLAFWDRSGDKRGNSNTAFLAEGTLTFDQIVAAAKAKFPKIWERFTFEVKLHQE